MLISLFNPLAILISLSTLTGVILHDLRLDKVAAMLTMPTALVSYEVDRKPIGGEAHTRVERNSFSQAMRVYQTSTPGMQPRVHEDRRHLMQRYVGRGHHAFDSYYLPLV